MITLEIRIELHGLILHSENEEGTRYAVERKGEKKSVGFVEFASDVQNNAFIVSSIDFNLEVCKKDTENAVDISSYCVEVIWGFASSAFEILDIESVVVSANLSEILTQKMIKYGFKEKSNKLVLVRSEWGGDNGELVSIALFDILGFSGLVSRHGNYAAMQLYRKLVTLIKNNSDEIFSISPLGPPWRDGTYVADNIGNIHISYFSDTFLIWTDYRDIGEKWLLGGEFTIADDDFPLPFGEPNTRYYPRFFQNHHRYLKFIDLCREFLCQAVIAGIPLRGCIATGLAKMDVNRSIFVGSPLVEAAKGELEQNSIGLAFGKSFNNHHPIWNRYHIPYVKHKKDSNKPNSYLSPMVVDYPRYWREHHSERDFIHLVKKMNTDPLFSHYYDNAIDFFKFSEENKEWYAEIDKEGIKHILDFYSRVNTWLASSEIVPTVESI